MMVGTTTFNLVSPLYISLPAIYFENPVDPHNPHDARCRNFVENVQPGLAVLSQPSIYFGNPVDPQKPHNVRFPKKVKPVFSAYQEVLEILELLIFSPHFFRKRVRGIQN